MSAPQRPLNGEQILQRIGAEATGRELITAADAAAARDAIEAQQQNDGLDFIASSDPTDPGFPPTSIPGSTYVLGTQGWQLTMVLNDIQDRYLPEHAIWIGSDGGTSEDFATGAKGRDLLAAADAAAARGALSLGTAATATLTTSATDTTAGRVTRVGDGGLLSGAQTPPGNTLSTDDRTARGFLYRIQSDTGDMPSAPRPFVNGMGIECAHNASRALQIMASTNTGSLELYAQVTSAADSTGIKEIYHTDNVTVDGSGFLKEASPIVRLYTDSIEEDSHVGATLEHPETGVYRISGTEGFAQSGWYIENYKDANGNIKAFVEYECIGGVIEVRTYEPTGTGWRAEKGEPMDIHSGRYITIRLHKTEEVSDEL